MSWWVGSDAGIYTHHRGDIGRGARKLEPESEVIGVLCQVCGRALRVDEIVVAVPLGPAANQKQNQAAGRSYTAIATLVHGQCAGKLTLDEFPG